MKSNMMGSPTTWSATMKRFGSVRLMAAMTLAGLVMLASTAQALPTQLTVQGQLRTAGGPAVDETYELTFSMWDQEEGGTMLWAETLTLGVEGSIFDAVLGMDVLNPLMPSVFVDTPQVWLGITVEDGPGVQVGGEDPLARTPMTTVGTAFVAQHALTAASASDVSCASAACVGVDELDFDVATQDELDAASVTSVDGLGGGEITGNVTVNGNLSATSINQGGVPVCDESGNCTGLAVTALAGSCEEGFSLAGINEDGSYNCVEVSAVVEADNINEISNDLIWNQFVDVFDSAATPTPIPDNFPTGITSVINVPDVGIAQKLVVSVSITNSDLSTVEVRLFDPNNELFSLVDGNLTDPIAGTDTTSQYAASFPDPTPSLSGDLTSWYDQNAQGNWSLQVIDTGFKDNDVDGALVTWSIQIQTLSNQKIQVKGDLIVDGGLQVGEGQDINIDGDVNIDGDLTVSGAIAVGNGQDEITLDGDVHVTGDLNLDGRPLHNGSVYRWQKFNTYDQYTWAFQNGTAFTGGVNPSTWTDSNAQANQISANKDIQRTLFTRKGYGGKNALVILDSRTYHSSTNGFVGLVLFRIKNETPDDINWTVNYHYTSYSGWGERASASLNGADTWNSGGSNCHFNTNCQVNLTFAIPADRTSTVIFVSTGGSRNTNRSHVLAFGSDSLELPPGLSYLDDLDTATGGYEQ